VKHPFGLAAYRSVSAALSPLSGAFLHARARAGKEDPARLGERFGRTHVRRPPGQLIWMHGASVGEARVLMQLVRAPHEARTDLYFLITTGTTTSAADVAAAALPRTIHQYAPFDPSSAATARFIVHWRPNLAVFAESEFWPNMLLRTAHARIPLALVNARLSPRSIANWQRFPESAARLLSSYDVLLAADMSSAAGLEKLSGKPVEHIGNLKLAAPAPEPNKDLLQALRAEIGARPVWLAASTHAGEEEIILAAHARLREIWPDALLLLAPRHPARGESLASLAGAAPRRSQGAPIGDASVYVVDTLGELGTFFALAPATFMAGSLLPALAGHNPIEPAKAGSAIVSGPHVRSFNDLYAALRAAGAMRLTHDANAIAAAIGDLWTNESARTAQVEAAARLVGGGQSTLSATVQRLLALLDRRGGNAPA
jgi:3-deoxy-D-manno-octulosonic-acid transferase